MAYFIGAVLAIVALVTFCNPFAGLLGLLAVNIIQPGELYPLLGALHVERVLAILVLLSFVLRHKVTFPPLTRLVLLFWGTMFLSVTFSVWRGGTVDLCLDFGKIFIYHILVANLVDSERRLKSFIITFTLLIGWLAASTFFGGGSYHAMDVDRVIGLTSASNSPNTLGITLVSALPIIVVLIMSTEIGVWRFVALAITALSVQTIVVTASRSSFYALLALTVLGSMWSHKRWLMLPAGCVLLLAVWVTMPTQYQARYETVGSLQNDASYQNRVIAWHAGVKMFEDSPIFGIGAGQFPVAAGTKYWPATQGHQRIWLQPHSLYVQAISEVGLLGTFAFSILLWSMFRTNRDTARSLAAIASAPLWMSRLPLACSFSMFSLLLVGYSGHNLYRDTWYLLAGITAATANIVCKLDCAIPSKDCADAALSCSGAPSEDLLPQLVAVSLELPNSGLKTKRTSWV
jgi:O-antigen ligase